MVAVSLRPLKVRVKILKSKRDSRQEHLFCVGAINVMRICIFRGK